MRNPGRPILAVCALLLAGGFLAGCASGKPQSLPTETPKSTPTPSPVFTSDAQALAAATEVYKKYLGVIDQIGEDGGANPDRLRPYVNEEGLKFEQLEARRLMASHAHQIGRTALTATRLQERSRDGVSLYACQDVSKVDVVDADGNSLVSASRPDSIPYIVTVTRSRTGSLIVASDKYWDGENVCP